MAKSIADLVKSRLERSAVFGDVRSKIIYILAPLFRMIIRFTGNCARNNYVHVTLANEKKPFAIRIASSDLWVFEEIFYYKEYGFLEEMSLQNIDIIVDVGANVGLSARYLINLFPSADIFTIEPDEMNAHLCDYNLALAGRNNRTTRVAIGVSAARAYLDRSKGAWMYHVSEGLSADGSPVQVQEFHEIIEKMDLKNDHKIDILKVDIEGAEKSLMAGAHKWIHRCRYIILELHKNVYTIADLRSDLRTGLNDGRKKLRPLLIREDVDTALVFIDNS